MDSDTDLAMTLIWHDTVLTNTPFKMSKSARLQEWGSATKEERQCLLSALHNGT